jgi:hypothetical protein
MERALGRAPGIAAAPLPENHMARSCYNLVFHDPRRHPIPGLALVLINKKNTAQMN